MDGRFVEVDDVGGCEIVVEDVDFGVDWVVVGFE